MTYSTQGPNLEILETTMPATLSQEELRASVVWQDGDRMSGTPCFTGTRVPVQSLFDYLEAGDSLDEFLDAFPDVWREQGLRINRRARGDLPDRDSDTLLRRGSPGERDTMYP
jgi:uncharacterized protein (DUF433 family)